MCLKLLHKFTKWYNLGRKVTGGALVFTVFWKTGVFEVSYEIDRSSIGQKGSESLSALVAL